MIDNVTGLRCKVGDEQSLYTAMKIFAEDRDQIEMMGKAGRERVIKDFDGEKMTALWVEYYHELLPV